MRCARYAGIPLVLLGALSALGGEFYVAPCGDDANPGTRKKPFATLTRAREAIRQTKAIAAEPMNVVIRGGRYYLREPLVLGPEDSGTAGHPITYMAHPGEKPVFCGGKVIKGWRRGQAGSWSVEIPEVKSGKWYFRQLHVNGRRRERARLPQEGWYKVAAPGDPPKRSFKFHPGQIDPKWRNLGDVEIVLLQFWSEARLRIESIDEANHIVRFTGDAFRPIDWSLGWYAENVGEGLTQPGRWYLDRQTGILTYWPLPGEEMERLEVIAPVAKGWVRLEGDYESGKLVEHVTFRGLTFHYSAWNLDKTLGYSYPQASIELFPRQKLWVGNHDDEGLSTPQSQVPVPAGIYAKGAHHIRFEDNEIAHTGAWGVHLAHGGCHDNAIVGNYFHDLGAGAIRVGGTDATFDPCEETCRTRITDNRIRQCAKVYFGAPAIHIGQSSGNRVAHNEISGGCPWAISVGWTWGYMPPNNARDNIIEYNHCHHIAGGVLGTHGAIYLIGVQPGTAVRYNFIHDITGTRTGWDAASGSGIVLDNSSVGIVVEHNVVRDVGAYCLLFNYNDLGNIVQNNILAFPGIAVMNRSGDAGKLDQTGVFYRNIFCYNGDKSRLFKAKDWANYDVVMDYNLYFDPSGKPVKFLSYDFQQWKEKGLDRKSIIADPLFVDVGKGDYGLKPDSPAFNLGFQPIDLSRVGPRPREASPVRSPTAMPW